MIINDKKYDTTLVGDGINGKVYSVTNSGNELGRVASGNGDGWFVVLSGNDRPTASGFRTRVAAIAALVEAYEAAQAADIAADYEDSEAAERVAAEEAAPALPLHVNVEINKRMHSAPATLFDMQPLQNFARCMPINTQITAKNGDVYFLWGASEFPAYMAEDGSAEIWAFPNSRPCRWLSISLGDAPRPAFVPERYDEDEQRAEFYREDAIPF